MTGYEYEVILQIGVNAKITDKETENLLKYKIKNILEESMPIFVKSIKKIELEEKDEPNKQK